VSKFKKIDERGIWGLKSKLFIFEIVKSNGWSLNVRPIDEVLIREVAEFGTVADRFSVDGKAWTSDEEVLARAEKLLEDLGYLDDGCHKKFWWKEE
jgi:hypothetical protein